MQVNNNFKQQEDLELLALMDQIEHQPDISEFVSDDVLDEYPSECDGTELEPVDYFTLDDILANRPDILDEHDLRYKLAKKLGWTNMSMTVAIPALETIIKTNDEHYRRNLMDENVSSNDLFGLLLCEDMPRDDYDLFITLRPMIESSMRDGLLYKQAIDKWF